MLNVWHARHPFGRRRMCFARTAALHCGNKKQKGNASRFFLQQSLHHAQKCHQERNMPTYDQLGAPKSRLERPKSRKKRPKGATNAARREKCATEALKSEKCANIEPTGRKFWPFWPGLVRYLAPPLRTKIHVD